MVFKNILNEVYYEYMEYEGKQVRGYNTIVYYENTMKNYIENSIGRILIYQPSSWQMTIS